MPGEYRLVVKDHDGTQIGVLAAYESLTYEKVLNDVGKAVLVANYGVTAAADALLDELEEDIILEVQRRASPSLDWYVDWIGFCEPPEEGLTPAATVKKTWTFQHANRLLKQRLVMPALDRPLYEQGMEYSLDRYVTSSMPANVMRDLVRDQCVQPADPTRRTPALFCEANQIPPAYAIGDPGLVYATENDPYLESVNVAYVWRGQLVIGTEDEIGLTRWAAVSTADGETWVNRLDTRPVADLCAFDDGPGERLYAAVSDPGWNIGYIYRSGINTLVSGSWLLAWNPGAPISACLTLVVHDGQLYVGTGYGRTGAPTYYARGRIYRSADGLAYGMVHDGDPGGGVFAQFNKYWAFEDLISWNGHIYAAGTYQTAQTIAGLGIVALRQGRVLRSVSGDLGSWDVVLDAVGPTVEMKISGWGLSGTVIGQTSIDGACCFCVFGAYLYVGIGSRIRAQYPLGQIYRTLDGENWEQVFGANLDAHPEYASPGVTSLAVYDGILWAGMGGPKRGDGAVWYSADGENWALSFDQRGNQAHACHTLCSWNGALYAGFGYIPNTTEGTTVGWNGSIGYLWRQAGGLWDSPAQEAEGGGRWPTVLSVLQNVADSTWDTEGGTDFGIEPVDMGGDLQEFMFRVRAPWGADRRSTSANPTLFGVNRGNMANPVYRKAKGDRPTAVYALATGQGADRIIMEMRDPAAESDSPWARTEGTIDVQGADTPRELWATAQGELRGEGPREEWSFTILDTPSTPYGEAWDVGTLATAYHNGRTIHFKITGTTVNLGNNPAVEEIQAQIRLLEVA